MADLNLPQKRGQRKLHAPRIDFTPMVDLGFLLITFFMYTTTLANPKTMELKMPSNEKTDHPTEVVAESVITVIATKGHRIIYYEGFLKAPDQLNTCPIIQIREVLSARKKQVAALPLKFSPAAHKVYVLIKPGADCTYSDVVRLLDEMIILDINNYAIMDIDSDELHCIQKKF